MLSQKSFARCTGHGQGHAHYAVARRRTIRTRSAIADEGIASSQPWFLKPAPTVGPITLKVIEDRGRGVLADRNIEQGEMLLCVSPVAIVNTQPGYPRASGEELVDHIIADQLFQRAWFQALYDGTPKSCKACPDLATPADAAGDPEFYNLSTPSTSAPTAAASEKGFAAAKASVKKSKVKRKVASSASGNSEGMVGGLDKKTAKRIALTAKFNCYGDNHEDLALCELRQEAARGHIGVWGPFAMLNHSCAPNAINYVVGDFMTVRAAKSIAAGEEVTISYLGMPQLTPVGARQVQLQDDYGFKCDCDRCTTELQHIDKIDESLYEELHLHTSNRMREQFEAAVRDNDKEELEELHNQIQMSLADLSKEFRRTLVTPTARLFIQASLYQALELQLDLCNALGLHEDRAFHLSQALKCIEAVTPGSDLHTILAAQNYTAQCDVHGRDSRQAEAALASARTAYTARYGTLDSSVFDQLMHLNRTLYK